MARFERPRGRPRRDSGRGRSRRDSDSGGFESYSRGRPRRDSGRGRDIERTEVTCSACGVKCEVPFKPTSSKPVYCDECFAKQGDSGSRRSSGRGPSRSSGKDYSKDLDIIKEKLNKIMESLKIKD